MSTLISRTYNCDKCNKKLKTYSNSIDIVTSLSEGSCWERLHVRIQNNSGVHNNGKLREAELCKNCAILLLEDALKRIKNGERASEGTEHSELQKWN
jgi:hypothetical protein